MSELYTSATFEDFWPVYVRMHSKPITQRLHAVASLSAGLLVVGSLVLRRPLLIAGAPVVDYAIAQLSHRIFQRNRTQPWRNLRWHARAELRMLRLTLKGQMRDETARWVRVP